MRYDKAKDFYNRLDWSPVLMTDYSISVNDVFRLMTEFSESQNGKQIKHPDEIQQLIKDNPKVLKHLPKTVYKEKITLEEAQFVIDCAKTYNDTRYAFYIGDVNKLLGINPDALTCRGLINLKREGVTEEMYQQALFNMFGAQYHKESMFKYLTMEFTSRKTKFDMYNIPIKYDDE